MRTKRVTSVLLRTAIAVLVVVLTLALGSEHSDRVVSYAQSCGGSIRSGQTVNGRISVAGGNCRYTFSGSSGDTVVIRMQKVSSDLDPYLELSDPSRQRVAADNNGAGGNDSLIWYTLRSKGTYTIVAGSYRDRTYGIFSLSLAVGNSNSFCGGSIGVGQTVTGRIPARGRDCRYTFRGTRGDRVAIRMEAWSSGLDPYLDLLDSNGRWLISNDNGGGSNNSLIRYTLRSSGTHTIVAGSYRDRTYGIFSLSLAK